MKRLIFLFAFCALFYQTQVECRRCPNGGPRGPKWNRGGRNDRWGGGRGPAMGLCPSFLRNLTVDAWEEYFDIMSNYTLTIAERNDKILYWGARYNISMELLQYKANMTIKQNEIRQNITQLISQLPAALQTFFSYVDDEHVTPIEHHEAISNLTKQNPELFDTIDFAAHLVLRKMYGPMCGMKGACGGRIPSFESLGLGCDCGKRRQGYQEEQWMPSSGGGYRWGGVDLSRNEDSWSMEDPRYMSGPASDGWGDYAVAYVGDRRRLPGNMEEFIEF